MNGSLKRDREELSVENGSQIQEQQLKRFEGKFAYYFLLIK